VAEVEYLRELDNTNICEAYDDVVKALKHCSLTKNVSENYAIQRELLSELALVLGILLKVKDEKEIKAKIKQTKGSDSSIFEYAICNINDKRGVTVTLKSTIIDVNGFPFDIFEGDNVNDVVKRTLFHSSGT